VKGELRNTILTFYQKFSRPCFTYWISTVHVFVLLFMVLNFGIGTDFLSIFYNPFGVIERSGNVMTSSLSAAHIVVWEQNNIWIGPKYVFFKIYFLFKIFF